MNLIKVGERIINLNLVTDVTLENPYNPGVVRVVTTDGGFDLKGKEAVALRWYLENLAIDVCEQYALDLQLRLEKGMKEVIG